MTRVQKLTWYANQLMSEAAEAEKSKVTETAVSKYLQAADILLLLSKSEQSYNAWKNYTDKAIVCHQKVRALIAAPRTPGQP